mgnify:CR=1 FL=1
MLSVFILMFLLALYFFQGLVTDLLSPFMRFFSEVGTAASVALSTEQDLFLQTQVQALAINAVEFDRLKTENETLREELGFLERTGFSAIGASILSKSLSQTVARFVLDVGEHQGVQVGDPVVAQNGLFVGKIFTVERNTSTAVALTDPTHTTAVSLINDRRTIGVAYGTVGGLLEIRFIPTDETIKINDLVVTSGLEETVPSGLLIGQVIGVEIDQNTLFQTALLEPLQDIRHLAHVLVLIDESL